MHRQTDRNLYGMLWNYLQNTLLNVKKVWDSECSRLSFVEERRKMGMFIHICWYLHQEILEGNTRSS